MERPVCVSAPLNTTTCIARKEPCSFFGKGLDHVDSVGNLVRLLCECIANSLPHVSVVHFGRAIIPFLCTGIGRLLLARSHTLQSKAWQHK